MPFTKSMMFCTSLLLLGCSTLQHQSGFGIQSEPSSISNEQEASSASPDAALPPQLDPAHSEIEQDGKIWKNEAFLHDEVARRFLLSKKRYCANFALDWSYDAEWPYPLRTLTLMPDNIDLRANRGFEAIFDGSFDEQCSHVFVIATKEGSDKGGLATAREIYSYDISAKTWEQVSQNISPSWNTMDEATPVISFLYPIDTENLLLSAQNPTTGGDAYTNQTSQGIFSLQSKDVAWFEHGGGLPPIIYNELQQRLSVFQYEKRGDRYVLERTDIVLPTLKRTTKELLSLSDPQELLDRFYGDGFPCLRVNFESLEEYTQCMNVFFDRAFPAGNEIELQAVSYNGMSYEEFARSPEVAEWMYEPEDPYHVTEELVEKNPSAGNYEVRAALAGSFGITFTDQKALPPGDETIAPCVLVAAVMVSHLKETGEYLLGKEGQTRCADESRENADYRAYLYWNDGQVGRGLAWDGDTETGLWLSTYRRAK